MFLHRSSNNFTARKWLHTNDTKESNRTRACVGVCLSRSLLRHIHQHVPRASALLSHLLLQRAGLRQRHADSAEDGGGRVARAYLLPWWLLHQVDTVWWVFSSACHLVPIPFVASGKNMRRLQRALKAYPPVVLDSDDFDSDYLKAHVMIKSGKLHLKVQCKCKRESRAVIPCICKRALYMKVHNVQRHGLFSTRSMRCAWGCCGKSGRVTTFMLDVVFWSHCTWVVDAKLCHLKLQIHAKYCGQSVTFCENYPSFSSPL